MTEKGNTWNQLLKNALSKQQIIQKNLLVLGNSSSGKRTLISKLQSISKTVFTKKYDPPLQISDDVLFAGIDYTYMDYQNEDITARINIFTLDSIKQQYLLRIFGNTEFFQNSLILIAIDWGNPREFIELINSYIKSLISLFSSLQLPLQKMDILREKLISLWSRFSETGLDEDSNFVIKDNKQIQIGPGCLEINIGIPIIVVLTKSDLVETVLREKDAETKLNMIQFSLRNLCLSYGASLVCCSQKNATINLNLLYEYIQYVFFDTPFKKKADVSYDQMFIPFGYDSQSLIYKTYPNFQPDEDYQKYFPAEELKKFTKTPTEVKCEDFQEFLKNLKQKLGKQQKPINPIEIQNPNSDDNVKLFYANLMKTTQATKVPTDMQKMRENAEQEIFNRLNNRKIGNLKTSDFDKTLDMINNTQNR